MTSVGGVDVGISPLAVDSGGQLPNPHSHYQPAPTASDPWQYPNSGGYEYVLRTLRRWQRAHRS